MRAVINDRQPMTILLLSHVDSGNGIDQAELYVTPRWLKFQFFKSCFKTTYSNPEG